MSFQRRARSISASIPDSRDFHHQIWGVFQAYYADGILAGTSPSTLSLMGSIPGAVGFQILFIEFTRDANIQLQLMTILSVVTGKLADR